MIAYPAIDLRGGRVVQLVGGRPEEERINLPDPAAVAQRWTSCGFVALHVIDLDAALGTGNNMPSIAAVADAAAPIPVQVGGGIRTTESASMLLQAGIARIVVGTRAVEDPEWLGELALRWPGRIVVAADVRDDEIVVRGWTEGSGQRADEFLERIGNLPLAAVLVTDVTREGRMMGVDADRFASLAAMTPVPLLASGGVAGIADLEALAAAGAAGVVLGMALYTGALDAAAVAREFCA
ncbi:1-(5-phosphoribosyl)-5-[(5-phosphoribosylamino)methylideneamino]imidazole-4-carboxamide isomerase [soil metagenome]